MPNHIVALALVTQDELRLLGPQFDRAFPRNETPCFGELLAAIDEADRELRRKRVEIEPVQVRRRRLPGSFGQCSI